MGERRGSGEGGRNDQTLYAHINKRKKILKLRIVIPQYPQGFVIGAP
jgi:hypothetical protein